ncbi:hypothetical protein [Dyadobacter chenhuakuii]|uniref:Uncharacterized protein n=1 Tax=Dyadobacter chenhuakuii TaxID=2909339 RepID=A0A9X1U2W9_9BACT|nr:hypothetical protein [Dyadobacter chenhuakuii]MCF2500966.1 hypothetical protein [Dyadobacter chenhuakuii]
MKERERISILEELMSENLIRLDRLESGQFDLKHGQNVLIRSVNDLNNLVWRNSNDIEVLKKDVAYLKENMATKQMFNTLLEAMTNGFDRTDRQFARMHDEMVLLRQDVNVLKAR